MELLPLPSHLTGPLLIAGLFSMAQDALGKLLILSGEISPTSNVQLVPNTSEKAASTTTTSVLCPHL